MKAIEVERTAAVDRAAAVDGGAAADRGAAVDGGAAAGADPLRVVPVAPACAPSAAIESRTSGEFLVINSSVRSAKRR